MSQMPEGPPHPQRIADGSHLRKARIARKKHKLRVLHEKPELAKHGLKREMTHGKR